MIVGLVGIVFIAHSFISLCFALQDPSIVLSTSSAAPQTAANVALSEKEGQVEGATEREYSPYIYLSVWDGYIFFGHGNTNGTVPQPLLHDPALKFAPDVITTIEIARFSKGPLGPGDLILYIVQSSIVYNNRSVSSGSITVAWSSNPGYCNPNGDGLFKDRCFVANFTWTPLDSYCENLEVYDPASPEEPVLKIERLCKTPTILYLFNSSLAYPRLSALRLSAFDTILSVTDGVTEEGQPKIVDHVLGDFDMDVLVGIGSFGKMSGPATDNFVGSLVPAGFGFHGGNVRWGYNFISPLQQSL
eukprot:jgi/Botrbrau1/19026/Bobra.0100s0056.2